jgi:hypothetical protein
MSKHLCLNGGHKGLINAKAVRVYPENIILTESPLDSLSLIQGGIENTIPCYGVNGFSELHLQTLKEARVKMITLAFDNDEAGKRGSEKLKEKLLNEGFFVKQIFPKEVKDWNDYLIKNGDLALLKKDIEEAEIFKPKGGEEPFSVTKEKGSYIFKREGVTYRVVGVKEVWISNLKVNIRLEVKGSTYPDNVDLYSARSRSLYSQNIARLFALEEKRIERDLLAVLELLEAEREKALFSGDEEKPLLSESDKALAMSFLTSKSMFTDIIQDTEILGYVGDEENKLLMYLTASSRLMEDPLSVIVVSQSSSGKSYLIDTIKKLMPEEDVVAITSLSDQALNYLPDGGLLHKFLVMGEAVHGEVVEHQIREMLSAKELSRLVTIKDEKTGKLMSKNVRTQVLVASVMSSTNWELNYENATRVFLISSDESVEQTQKIHQAQRKKYSLSRYEEKRGRVPEIIRKHKAAQRLLTGRLIVNPFLELLDFPDTLMRTRRDHERFIDLIASISFLRQYQKEEKKTRLSETGEEFVYIECDLEDYAIAYRILRGTLSVTFSHFPKSALALYEAVRELLKKKAKSENLKPTEVSVSQREIREVTGHNQMFVKRYVKLLLEYEYLKTGGSSGRGLRNVYYLIADEEVHLLDLSRIPAPEEMEARLKEKK